MHEFAFDLTLSVALRVNAKSFDEAVKLLCDLLDCADSNFGAWPNGDPINAEASLAKVPTKEDLYEMDGEEPTICPDCCAIEGTEEWGTVGDGFDGYCPSCADKREETEE